MGKAAEMLLPIEGIKVKSSNFKLVILNANAEQIHAAKIIDFSPQRNSADQSQLCAFCFTSEITHF